MPVSFQNFDFQYVSGEKPYFAPSDLGRRIGADIKQQVEQAYTFGDFVYHLRKGGHVSALHSHRPHAFFARVDIKRFFYSISRSRVQRALAEIGILRARHYAKWSCVRNPYGEPRYALPYGFIQSPILATLVLMQSVAGAFLRELHSNTHITVSLYMDDIALSSNSIDDLDRAFAALLERLAEAQFSLSERKTRTPARAIDLFNCDLTEGRTEVMDARVEEFARSDPSDKALEGFVRYQLSVEHGNNTP